MNKELLHRFHLLSANVPGLFSLFSFSRVVVSEKWTDKHLCHKHRIKINNSQIVHHTSYKTCLLADRSLSNPSMTQRLSHAITPLHLIE